MSKFAVTVQVGDLAGRIPPVRRVGTYRRGLRHGTWRTYRTDGTLLVEVFFRDGLPVERQGKDLEAAGPLAPMDDAVRSGEKGP